MISIALIEDNRLVREGIETLLNQLPDIRVVAGQSGFNAPLLTRLQPHVILLDLGLRNGDSLRIALRIQTELPAARVIVMDLLTVHEDMVEFLAAGVVGFITKDATLDDLAHAIRSVANGKKVLPLHVADSLFRHVVKRAVVEGSPELLTAVRMTKREREVIGLISDGLSNKDIARRLRIASHTVKSHVRNVMEKLELHTRLQIAAYAHGESRAADAAERGAPSAQRPAPSAQRPAPSAQRPGGE